MNIEEIKQRKDEGKKKWGFFLILFIKENYNKNAPYEFITKELNDKYQISLSIHELTNLFYSFNKKNKVSNNVDKTILPFNKEKFEIGEKKEIVQNEDKKIDISKLDFRTPTQKPTSENWKK